MKLFELERKYYHGSYEALPVGTMLTARDDYENDWNNTSFYSALEAYRPSSMLAHKQSVFMVSDPDDIDLAGGATDFMLTVQPLGRVERHDINWGSEISMLIDQGYDIDSTEVKNAADAYWSGKPHPNESVWEYLTPKAKVVKVEDY
jgi:hypothetical protein